MIVSYERTGIFLQNFNFLKKMSEDYFVKIKRVLSEYQLF